MDEAEWSALSEGSPLRRAGQNGLARNAAIVLGNAGDRGSLPALSRAATEHPHPTVRDAAQWAVGRLSR
jgi:epoxyqueuosine reductase